MQLVQTVASDNEPITLEDAKSFLRVLDNDDDVLISSLISAARQRAEDLTGRQLMSATYELYSEAFMTKLPKNPIQSIEKIEYMDENGVYQVLDSSFYYLYEDLEIGMIKYVELPILPIAHKKAVRITFVSGYEEVPEPIKAYIRVKVSTLYEHREEFVVGLSVNAFGDTLVENILNPYKIKEF